VLADRLERIYRLATQTGHVARFVVFGSFVTDKPEPNDVDVFMIMDDNFDMRSLVGEPRLLKPLPGKVQRPIYPTATWPFPLPTGSLLPDRLQYVRSRR
jgi:hypothetical protein